MDDHFGLYEQNTYTIDLKEILNYLQIKSNIEQIRSFFINNKYEQYINGQDYIIQSFSQIGIEKRNKGIEDENNYEYRDNKLVISLESFKLWLLRYDKNNKKIKLFKMYFIMMEHIFFKRLQQSLKGFLELRQSLRLQQQYDRIQDHWKDMLKICDQNKQDDECFFYKLKQQSWENKLRQNNIICKSEWL
ncbi:hypothetical protein ABPG72_018972 [Tetrahymena utriculariae]